MLKRLFYSDPRKREIRMLEKEILRKRSRMKALNYFGTFHKFDRLSASEQKEYLSLSKEIRELERKILQKQGYVF